MEGLNFNLSNLWFGIGGCIREVRKVKTWNTCMELLLSKKLMARIPQRGKEFIRKGNVLLAIKRCDRSIYHKRQSIAQFRRRKFKRNADVVRNRDGITDEYHQDWCIGQVLHCVSVIWFFLESALHIRRILHYRNWQKRIFLIHTWDSWTWI
jgi:hypothetical protein